MRGVGNQHQLYAVQPVRRRGRSAQDLHDFVEDRRNGRLAVAAEGDVVQAAIFRRRGARIAGLSNSPPPTASSTISSNSSRSCGRSSLRRTVRAGHGAVNLAIDAIEVAVFVWIDVHADRDAARPPADHGVDEAVVLEAPHVRFEQFESRAWGSWRIHTSPPESRSFCRKGSFADPPERQPKGHSDTQSSPGNADLQHPQVVNSSRATVVNSPSSRRRRMKSL